jgi:5-methylcytosine-specific restriction protein A
MPAKPKSPCGFPGCALLCSERYCEEHEKLINKHYERFKRDKITWRRYGTRWRKIRKVFLKQNPLCEECQKYGKLTPSNEVHYIEPVACGGTHDASNLMSLCKRCHSSFTAREHGFM